MFASKLVTELLPNIHLLGMFIVLFTVVFRKKALIPLYIFILLTGVYAGFSMWWIPYLYIWTVLWGMAMCIPQNLAPKWYWIYPVVCGLHGFAYGTLYAPAQAIMFGYDKNQTLMWIAQGLPWDAIHGISNIAAGCLVAPLAIWMRRILSRFQY